MSAVRNASISTRVTAPDGNLYVAWATADHVAVARSTNNGRSFSDPVAVNPDAAKIDPVDSRPSIAIGGDGKTVAYTVFTGADYVGRIYVAQSGDGE